MKIKAVSGIMLTLLLTSMLTLAFNIQPVRASGPIYIKADGSVEGTTDITSVDNITYTFTANIYDEIVVEKDNIVVDGAGYTLQGTGAVSSKGIFLPYRSNVTIKNMEIKSFWDSIHLFESSNNTVSGNNITNNNYSGVYLSNSHNNTVSENNITNNYNGIRLIESSNYNRISGNNITANNMFGIHSCESSNYNSISGNNITNNYNGIRLVSSSNNNIISGNNITQNNRGGIWLGESSNNIISGNNIATNGIIGIQVGLWDIDGPANNNIISGNNITQNNYGIRLSWSSNNIISANMFVDDGLALDYSYGNVVEHNLVNGKPLVYFEGKSNLKIDHAGQIILINCNNITVKNLNLSNTDIGIQLWNTSNCTISGNNITNNYNGIRLIESSNYNSISGNNITANNMFGIHSCESSNYNSISGNNITNNSGGIFIHYSSNNIISGNNITNNYDGILFDVSSNNKFYHNNFIDNSQQVHIWSSGFANVWDDGYPSGGNYWSDHDCTGNPSDGSQPYIIDANNIDHYPFQDPNGWINTLTIYSSPTGVTFTVDGVSRTTPWSGTYNEGTSVSLVMPEIHTFGDVRYYWSQWSDGITSRSRTVTMTTNIMLTAYYTGPYYELTVTSSLMTGITFTINGTPETTPYTEWLLEGSYTLEMPETHDGYVWSHWLEDEDTIRIKAVTMDTDTILTGVFTPETTAPTTLDDYDGLWHNTDFTITLTATDDASGVDETYYSINDGPTKSVSIDGHPLITTQGVNNKLEYWSVDNAGNEEAHHILTNIKLDKTEPTADVGQDRTVDVGTAATFDASGSTDDLSGVVSCEWDFGDGATETGITCSHTYAKPDTYTVTLTVKDTAGNSNTDSIAITVTSEGFPLWILGVVTGIAIVGIALGIFFLRRRSTSIARD